MNLETFGWDVDADGIATATFDVPGRSMNTLTAKAIADLGARRWAAKQAKDFAAADRLRQELTAAGWTMLDRKDGFDLRPL